MSDMKSAIEGFDEAAYLKLIPIFGPPWTKEFFHRDWPITSLTVGTKIARDTRQTDTQLHDAREFRFTGPVPPEALRRRVHGNGDLASFETIGKIVSYNIYGAIHATLELSAESRVLDFGCGCGRVLRYFHELLATGTCYARTSTKRR